LGFVVAVLAIAASSIHLDVAAAAAPAPMSGADIIAAKCSTCHQANGRGTALIPPLAANADVLTADPKAMVAIIVNGRTGPIVVAGKTYNGTMPVWRGLLSTTDIAAVATYVRSAWGNTAAAVTEPQIAAAGTPVLNTVGASIYAKRCSACHQVSGKGGGPFPALAGNAHINAMDAAPMLGTIVHGRNVMPAWKGQLSAGDIAAVATYVRSAWGNTGGPVNEADVSAIK
jgi:cbb3-type cytochrome c oxidase subunit III